MELITKQLPRDYHLYMVSDLHIGSPNSCEDKLETAIETIRRDPKGYCVVLGDSIEAITNNDKRFTHAHKPYATPQQQAERVIELFKPIAKKVLVWLMGNHGYHLINTCDFDRMIADALGVSYGMYCAKLIVKDFDDKLQHKYFLTHGMGMVQSNAKTMIQATANKQMSLRNKLEKYAHADCIVSAMGHTHQLMICPPVIHNQLYMTDDGEGLHQHYRQESDQTASYINPDGRWYCNTGSFMKLYATPGSGYVSYAEVAGYPPSELGYIKSIVRGGIVKEVQKVVV